MICRHCISVRGQIVTAVRERIERVLGVETTARYGRGMWDIYFDAPNDTDFGFLRPDVLPPLDWSLKSRGA